MKTYPQFCSEVAIKHGLGKSLVIGHKPTYFSEAAELYVNQFKYNTTTGVITNNFTRDQVIRIVAEFAKNFDSGRMFDGSETMDQAIEEVKDYIKWDA